MARMAGSARRATKATRARRARGAKGLGGLKKFQKLGWKRSFQNWFEKKKKKRHLLISRMARARGSRDQKDKLYTVKNLRTKLVKLSNHFCGFYAQIVTIYFYLVIYTANFVIL